MPGVLVSYSKSREFQVGNNPGCGTQGFNATAGWDPSEFGILVLIVFLAHGMLSNFSSHRIGHPQLPEATGLGGLIALLDGAWENGIYIW